MNVTRAQGAARGTEACSAPSTGGHKAVPGSLFEGAGHVASEVDIVDLNWMTEITSPIQILLGVRRRMNAQDES